VFISHPAHVCYISTHIIVIQLIILVIMRYDYKYEMVQVL
jgi:hypothetical protein